MVPNNSYSKDRWTMENFAFAITVSLILHFFKGSGPSAILTQPDSTSLQVSVLFHCHALFPQVQVQLPVNICTRDWKVI